MWDSPAFFGALTPKFYVALTGTSSLISGLILIFEWWYFRKYGTSFIEQVSGCAPPAPSPAPVPRVSRNPWAPLRGADYGREWARTRRAPLSFQDMNLSAQEHQAWFGGGGDLLDRAYREREPSARVQIAHAALALDPSCPAALLLLAEEDAPTVRDADLLLRKAWRSADVLVRMTPRGERLRRMQNMLVYVKRRSGECARRLGRLREAARTFRELCRESPPPPGVHENLLAVLMDQRAYGEAAALVARLQEAGGSADSAAVAYTGALLALRAAGAGLGSAESARMAVRRAVCLNPRVVPYLLEQTPLVLPPEHLAAGGESEARAYAAVGLRWWRAGGSDAEEALRAESGMCGGAQALGDAALLPGWSAGGVHGGPGRGVGLVLLMMVVLLVGGLVIAGAPWTAGGTAMNPVDFLKLIAAL